MSTRISPIIQSEELQRLYQQNNLVIVDAGSGESARKAYEERHLDGAVYADLDAQLAKVTEDAAKGGRHPLPSIEEFAHTLGALGITPDSHVIVYDDKGGANAAARFWWMLKAIRHETVQVLNGGMQEAENANLPMGSGAASPMKEAPYPVAVNDWQLPTASLQEVAKAAQSDKAVVIDVRSPERFKGETEPIDLIAGHIPGAVNIPFSGNLDAQGRFFSPDQLKSKYQGLIDEHKAEGVIVHCGSGVTACHTLLAMAYAGLQIPKLYVGSWSEWSRNNKPVATT